MEHALGPGLVVAQLRIVRAQRVQQLRRARLDVEIGVVVAGLAQPRRVVNQRVVAVQRVEVAVVLVVLPLVGHHRVGMLHHEAGEVVPAMEHGLVLAHQVERVGQIEHGGVVFQMQRVEHLHRGHGRRVGTVGLVADQHRYRAGLHHRDVGLEDGHPKARRFGRARRVAKGVAGGPHLGHALRQKPGRPEVRSLMRRASMNRAHHRQKRRILGQQPDLVAAVVARKAALVGEQDRLGRAHIGLPDAHIHGPTAAGAKVGQPLRVQGARQFDHDVDRIDQLAGPRE